MHQMKPELFLKLWLIQKYLFVIYQNFFNNRLELNLQYYKIVQNFKNIVYLLLYQVKRQLLCQIENQQSLLQHINNRHSEKNHTDSHIKHCLSLANLPGLHLLFLQFLLITQFLNIPAQNLPVAVSLQITQFLLFELRSSVGYHVFVQAQNVLHFYFRNVAVDWNFVVQFGNVLVEFVRLNGNQVLWEFF